MVHEPVGVVAAVLPFNWPVAVMANKVLPALLTGNTVVAKAPPTCPGAVLAAAAVLAEGLPPGVVNVLNGPGRELGEALVAHPGVDLVSFTGGPGTGQSVMATAARRTTPVVLELGGNDPAVLAPDVVVDDALADQLVSAAFVTSGQVCMAVKRLYVPEELLGEVVEGLVARLATEVVGDGLVDGVTMGPVHQASARDRVERMISEAVAGGGRVHRPATVRPEDEEACGYLVSPALVESPPPDSALVRQEQFAPALPVLGYTTSGRRRGRGQRHRVRVVRLDLDRGRRVGGVGGTTAPGGHRLRQLSRHGGHGLPGTHGRMEGVRVRTGARTRGDAGVDPTQDGAHPPPGARRAVTGGS